MKSNLSLSPGLLLATVMALVMTAATTQATLYSYTFNSGFNSGSTVPDGNPNGWTDSRSISDITPTEQVINGLTVHVNVSGGYNGDLYGYLLLTDSSTHAALGFSVLLNQVGLGTGTGSTLTYGYSDTSLNVALSDTGANGNIHNYQNVSGYAGLINSGGAFQTDGGNLSAFDGASANNIWTLYLADLSTGSIMTVNSWGFDIYVIPEPATWAVLIFGVFAAGIQAVRRLKISKEDTGR